MLPDYPNSQESSNKCVSCTAGVQYSEKEEVRSLLKKVQASFAGLSRLLNITFKNLSMYGPLRMDLYLSRDDFLNFWNACAKCLQDPLFWTRRPWTEMMKRAASDDVRFLPLIQRRMEKNLKSCAVWQLYTRGALYCRCFCASDNGFAGWPIPPRHPGKPSFLFNMMSWLFCYQ